MDKKIEEIDRQIISLISQRTELFIDELKKKKGTPAEIYFPSDISQIVAINKGPLSDNAIKNIYNELILSSIMLINPVSVAFLGPEGTYSYSALLEIFGSSVRMISQGSISGVFNEVEAGRAVFGVVPIENSTEGGVTYTLDALLDTDVSIVAEKYLKISVSVLSKCKNLKEIKKIYTHTQPLAQSKGWIKENLPGTEIQYANSTTLAAEFASNDDCSAALASEISARIYELNILASNIQDLSQNSTRFFVIGKGSNKSTGKDKTSIVCAVKDKPGALLSVLQPIKEAGINMTRIESRPDKKKMWAYNFFIDLAGHKDDITVRNTLDRLKEESIFLKVLGSYPAES